ncbi:MAG: hypothetical protein ACQEXJ_02345 [Myxococcota bacterium]
MATQVRRARIPCQHAAAWCIGLLLMAASPGTSAQEQVTRVGEAEPQRYQGGFWAVQAHAGVLGRVEAGPDETVGPALGASLRLASILSIADVQATLLGGGYRTTSRAGGEVGVRRWSVGGELHVHPLFLAHLYNTRPWFVLAGLYVSAGLDLDVTHLAPARGDTRRELDLGWHLGAGADVPLTDPHAGSGVWLGLAFRQKFLSVASGPLGLGDFDERVFLLTLAWRDNDLSFARVPRPDELRPQEARP